MTFFHPDFLTLSSSRFLDDPGGGKFDEFTFEISLLFLHVGEFASLPKTMLLSGYPGATGVMVELMAAAVSLVLTVAFSAGV